MPLGFASRHEDCSDAVDKLDARLGVEVDARGRTYAMALWAAFVGLTEAVLAGSGETSTDGFLTKYPAEATDARGRTAKTLTIKVAGKPIGIRKFVNAFASAAWDTGREFPNSPGHATWGWREYDGVIDAIAALSPGERTCLVRRVWERMLTKIRKDAAGIATPTPRPFEELLQDFYQVHGDPPGSVLQGLVYGYVRADAPDVAIETGKTGSGSSRTRRIGDVDGRSGKALVLTYEVKDRDIDGRNCHDEFGGWLRNRRSQPDSTAIAVANSFTDEAKEELKKQKVVAITREEMLASVRLWDVRKQALAARSFEHYISRVERSERLVERFEQFVEDNGLDIG